MVVEVGVVALAVAGIGGAVWVLVDWRLRPARRRLAALERARDSDDAKTIVLSLVRPPGADPSLPEIRRYPGTIYRAGAVIGNLALAPQDGLTPDVLAAVHVLKGRIKGDGK